jgi:nitrate reductase gamma subunit
VLPAAIYICAYLSVFLFLLGLALKIARYKRNPMHLRWELYPVAHEAEKGGYGGSYLEETDWAKKPRRKSLIGELRVMLPEIFFLKAVYASNRSLWCASLPFHLGLYCTAVFLIALFKGAIAEAAGFTALFSGGTWFLFLNCLGLCGFSLSIIGALALICRRAADDHLREYTSFGHYFNLGLFALVIGTALRAWFASGHSFSGFHGFAVALVRFNLGQQIPPPVIAPVIMGAALFAYIPWTHMAHFFMKYYIYHDIRWGDEPVADKEAGALLGEVLNYKPTWAAGHVRADGKSSWADLAKDNPAREQPKE